MRRTSFQNDHPAMGFPIAAQTILLAQGLTGDAASSRAQILKAEEAAPILDAIWKAPSFGKAFELTLEYGCGKALAGITKVAKTCSASSQHELELEGGEADLGRVRPALTKSQCDVLCEGLQLGYRWVPWRPLVPWWDVERTESNVGQVLRCAPQAKMSLGSSPARGLPSRFLGEASGDNKCIIVQSRGQRARVRGTLAARSDASTARSEGELTRWGAFGKFTGKEEDAEVGLTYFGKRYLNAYLGRWISADPLAIHAPGEADLNVYAYVSGSILKNVDPLGLEEQTVDAANAGGASAADPAEHMGTGHEGASSDGSYLEATSDPEWQKGAGGALAGVALTGCAIASAGACAAGLVQFELTRQAIADTPASPGSQEAQNREIASDSNGAMLVAGATAKAAAPVAVAAGRAALAGARSVVAPWLREWAKKSGLFEKTSSIRTAASEAGEIGGSKPETGLIADVTVESRGEVLGRGTVDVRGTLERIKSGDLQPRDTFRNREGLLPSQPDGYYKEFYHPTPGYKGTGPERVIRGDGGEFFYTPNHYKSFIPLN